MFWGRNEDNDFGACMHWVAKDGDREVMVKYYISIGEENKKFEDKKYHLYTPIDTFLIDDLNYFLEFLDNKEL